MVNHEVEISVYENDSTDGTKNLLKRYCELLSKRCKTTFTSTDIGTEHLVGKEGARVKNIANARNACIEQASSIEQFDRIVFIETDVLYKPMDAATIINHEGDIVSVYNQCHGAILRRLGNQKNIGRDVVESWDSIRKH